MNYQSVTDLPGIGVTLGGRLNQAGYRSAQDVYDKFSSLNFDRNRCEGWLHSVRNANSRYSSMCYEALRGSYQPPTQRSYSPIQQRYQSYRSETPEYRYLQSTPSNARSIEVEPMNLGSLPSWLQTPEKTLQSPVSTSRSDISKAEVIQMMAEFRNKQDIMATRISDLEQEKTKTKDYIKTLETKIDIMGKKATELVKRHNEKVAALTNKLHVMDLTQEYKDISNSIYFLSKKFDEILKKKTTIKSLETKIERHKENVTKHQNQQDEKLIALSKTINDTNSHMDRYKELSNSISILTRKFDEIIKQQREQIQDKLTQKLLDAKIKHLEQNLRSLTSELRYVTHTATAIEEKVPEVKFSLDHKHDKNDQLLSDKTVEQVELSNDQNKSKVSHLNINSESQSKANLKLTAQTWQLLQQVKEFACINDFKYCWVSSHNSTVIYLMHRSQKAPLIRIDNEDDLEKLKMKLTKLT